jgi:hypothetical protein
LEQLLVAKDAEIEALRLAKDAEIAEWRAVSAAQDGRIKAQDERLTARDLTIAELQRRLGAGSEDSGTPSSKEGLGVLYTPAGDGGVHTAVNAPRPSPAASQRHVPVCPAQRPDPDSYADEASAGFPVSHPMPSLPLTCLRIPHE